MVTGGRVGVSALRRLTYTLLINSILSACMFICTSVSVLILNTSETVFSTACIIYGIFQSLKFLTSIACVMCLGEISTLSKELLYSQRILAAALIAQCMAFLPRIADLFLLSSGYDIDVSVINKLLSAIFAAERLLVGAAFMFLMKGMGESLRENSNAASVQPFERLGIIYFCLYIVSIIPAIVSVSRGEESVLYIASAFHLVCAILEFFMYRMTSAASFRIWRKKAFDVSV